MDRLRSYNVKVNITSNGGKVCEREVSKSEKNKKIEHLNCHQEVGK